MQRPAAAALQSQDAQHQQQSYQRQHAQAQQYADSSFSGSYDLPQQQSMSSFASGGMIGNPANMSNGYNGMQEPSAADFSAFLSSYQPLTSNTSFDNSMPDTAHLGLAPTMGSTDALPQLDAATAAAAAAAYGSLGRSTIANASNQMEGSNHYPTLQGTGNGNAYPAVSQRSGMNDGPHGPRLAPQQRNTQQRPDGSFNTRRSDSSATQPGQMGPGIGYEGDGSNSASTQTPAPSSSGEDQEALRVGHLGGSNGLLPPHMLSEQIRSSSSASTSSASMFGQQFGNSQQKYQPRAVQSQAPGGRARRAQSGSYGAGELNARDGLTSSGKRLSGPAITTSGTTNNPRPSHHNANPSLHQPVGKPIAAGHAASHPPGTGNQILRGTDGHASGSNAASDFTRRKGWHTRIVDELLDFVHILDKDGKVLFAASSIGAITGWKPEELVGSNVCEFIHPDDARDFLRGFQSCYKDRSEMVQYYRFRKKPQTAADKLKVREQVAATDVGRSASHSEEGDSSNQDSATRLPSPKFTDAARATGVANGDDDETDLVDDASDSYVVMEISGHPYFWTEGADQEAAAEAAADFANGLVHSPKNERAMSPRAEDEKFRQAENDSTAADGGETRKRVQCFFCSGRVYPTKNIGMLDSFLELKLENERLRTLLGELSLNDGSTDHTGGSSDGRRSLEEVGYNPDYTVFDGVQPGATAGRSGNVSFDLGDSAKHDDTVDVNDRRLSGHSPPGLQSNPTSPHSVGLDRGIPSADVTQEDDEESDKVESPTPGDDDADRHKKKKTKQEEGDFVCTDCGRVDSPEWRKGPLGPKTLCNACGLRWAKKVKRSGGDPNAMVGKGIQPHSGIKVQQPFGDFGGGNPFADDSRNASMSSEPQVGQISGAPGYATMGIGQPDMPMMNHNPFQQYTPHQTNHPAHSSHQVSASMQQHHLHQAQQQQQHQSMLGAVQGLYDQGNPFAHSQSPQQHHLGGQQMPQHLPHDLGGAGNSFLGHDASLSSVLMNPHQRPQPQHSHSAAPNMMGHMYGGGAS